MTELQTTIKSLIQTIIDETILLGRLERQQKEIEKNPPHKWEHGDIYKSNTGCIMVYLKFTSGPPLTVCIRGRTGGMVERKHFDNALKDATFLFNIREKL